MDAYLRELDGELRDLPAPRRRDLVEEIREHIASALSEARDDGEAEIRNVLERLGDPAEIAAAARERFGVHRATTSVRDIVTVILLLFGGFLWLVGWVVGAILLATSTAWTSREKVIGLLVVPGGLLPAFLFGVLPAQVCSETSVNGRVVAETCSGGGIPVWLAYAILAVLVIGPIWTAFFLLRRMNRHAPTA